jgi:hypothetical protein
LFLEHLLDPLAIPIKLESIVILIIIVNNSAIDGLVRGYLFALDASLVIDLMKNLAGILCGNEAYLAFFRFVILHLCWFNIILIIGMILFILHFIDIAAIALTYKIVRGYLISTAHLAKGGVNNGRLI